MSGTFLQNCERAFRIVFLFAVFTGLLFSCGEGIRLFPFPPAEKSRNNLFRLESQTESGYEKNIHRFENTQLNSQSKSQRDNRQTHWSGVCHAHENFSFLNSSDCSEINTSFNTQTFHSRFAFSLISSRAPPIS
ncbi:MAG TPA: hypothetical protein VF556_05970 [Pyrinomonadaceae bacterium]